jgi:hypothetical protein
MMAGSAVQKHKRLFKQIQQLEPEIESIMLELNGVDLFDTQEDRQLIERQYAAMLEYHAVLRARIIKEYTEVTK